MPKNGLGIEEALDIELAADPPPIKPLLEKRKERLWSANELCGYTLQAQDGETGRVHDFYFDDKSWTIHYLVVDIGDWLLDTGEWIPGQKVLVATADCGQPHQATQMLPLTLTKEQVQQNPDDQDSEALLHNSSLYSAKEVIGSYIHTLDGSLGHVEDFILDAEQWVVALMVIDTRNWWPSKKVAITPVWIDQIDLSSCIVYVGLSQEFIKNSPAFEGKTLRS